jgi:hypothetical protein
MYTLCIRYPISPNERKEFKGYVEAEQGLHSTRRPQVEDFQKRPCAPGLQKSSMNALHNNVIVSDGLRRSSRFRLE